MTTSSTAARRRVRYIEAPAAGNEEDRLNLSEASCASRNIRKRNGSGHRRVGGSKRMPRADRRVPLRPMQSFGSYRKLIPRAPLPSPEPRDDGRAPPDVRTRPAGEEAPSV